MKKGRGRPKGSKGPIKRYLDHLCNAKKIESSLKLTYIKDGKKRVDKRNVVIESDVDIGHELMITLLTKALKGDNHAMSMYMDRRYGRVVTPREEEDTKAKGLIIQAIKELYINE